MKWFLIYTVITKFDHFQNSSHLAPFDVYFIPKNKLVLKGTQFESQFDLKNLKDEEKTWMSLQLNKIPVGLG